MSITGGRGNPIDDILDPGSTTDAASTGTEAGVSQGTQIWIGAVLEDHGDDIERFLDIAFSAVGHARRGLGRSQQTLGDQEPDRQVEIISGSSHRGGDQLILLGALMVPAQPDLQRFLDSDLVESTRRAARAGASYRESHRPPVGDWLLLCHPGAALLRGAIARCSGRITAMAPFSYWTPGISG